MVAAIAVTSHGSDLQEQSQHQVRPDTVAKTIVVIDRVGQVFARLRALELSVALWRVDDAAHARTAIEADLVVYAAYGPMDWERLPHTDGDAAHVVITTTFRSEEAEAALDHGLIGYLDASMDAEVLGRAIRGVLLHGESAFPRDVIGHWMRARHSGHDGVSAMSGLTERQQEIVRLIARGATDKEIAAELGIASATAQKHVTNILQRLHVPNRAAAVAATSGRGRT